MRPLLEVFIYLSQHLVLTFACFFAWGWWMARLDLGWDRLGSRSPQTWRGLTVGIAAVLCAVFGAIGAWYVKVGGFAGEVEPIVSCLSWLFKSGQPLYTDFNTAERYSVLYGPAVFLTNGLFLEFLGPSLAATKLASLFGSFGSLVFLYAAVARRSRDRLALAVTGLAVLYYWTQGFAAYLVRPDALLLFAVGLGLFATVKLRRVLALVTVAFAAGFAVNLKVHGALYFLPIFVLLYQRFGGRAMLQTWLGTVLVVGAPFVLYPQVSLVNYISWLTNAISHGLETYSLQQNLRYAGFLLLPLVAVVVAAADRRRLLRKYRLLLLVLGPVFGLILLLAAKPGAGAVHLLPLVPTTMYVLATIYRGLGEQTPGPLARPVWRQAALTATVLTALLTGTINAYRAVRYVDHQIAQTPDLMQDVQQIMRAYPELPLAMACGGENLSFRATFLRPLLVFANHPLLIDPISVMDSSLSGRALSPATYAALSDGRVAVWLVPRRQAPFAKVNWYAPHNPLFPKDFQELFVSCYTRRAHSRYFDLWFWNGLTTSDGALPDNTVIGDGTSMATGP